MSTPDPKIFKRIAAMDADEARWRLVTIVKAMEGWQKAEEAAWHRSRTDKWLPECLAAISEASAYEYCRRRITQIISSHGGAEGAGNTPSVNSVPLCDTQSQTQK